MDQSDSHKNKVIAFSLFGPKDLYLIGAVENAREANIFYPGWRTVFFVGESVPREVIQELLQAHAEVVHVELAEDFKSAFWRFKAACMPDVSHVIFRDADSRFSRREVTAVEEWIRSGQPLHTIRDHPHHIWQVQAGMFGVTGDAIATLCRAQKQDYEGDYYGADQDFLRRNLWLPYRKVAFVHDLLRMPCENSHPLSREKGDLSFIGERVFVDRTVDPNVRNLIQKFHSSRSYRLETYLRVAKHRLLSALSDYLVRLNLRRI